MNRRTSDTAVAIAVMLVALLAAACGSDDRTTPTAPVDSAPTTEEAGHSDDGPHFPDVIGVRATPDGPNSWRFDVTISSPYDSPEQYADAWRVLGPDGTEYGLRILTHDHASEQPFTRSQSGIEIPPDVTRVTVEGRDLRNGWGGATVELELPNPG